jgi:hypothetical protein
VNIQRSPQDKEDDGTSANTQRRRGKPTTLYQVIFRNKTKDVTEIQGTKRNQERYRRFNTVGTHLTERFNPPPQPETNSMDHFLDSENDVFEQALQDLGDAGMVGIAIHNEINQTIGR